MSKEPLRGQGLLEPICSEYTYLDIIGKLRGGISPSTLADLCGYKEQDLLRKINEKGYDCNGEPLNKSSICVKSDEYTPITPEIEKLLLDGLKHGYDTDYLIEYYKLDRTKAAGVILDLRRKMKDDAAKLYPLSSIKGVKGKYKTMFTVYKKDLE